MTTCRFPAEWERHDATWIAWPHHEPDWPGKFESIRWVYAEIVRALHTAERVEILCHDDAIHAEAGQCLLSHGVDLTRCRLHRCRTDRVWLRDSAPTFVMRDGAPSWCNWGFTAWAKYDNFAMDADVGTCVARASGIPRREPRRPDGAGAAVPAHAGTTGPLRVVLEGGGIETDGAGTLLVTEEWLLSDVQVRNPGFSRRDYEQLFRDELGITQTVWLGEGCVGDDTHGHVDDIARFVAPGVVLLAHEPDPSDENHGRSLDNLERLARARDAAGRSLRVVPLPFPRAVMMDGQRLPASYANFYIANGVVLVPTFNDRADRVALDIIARELPSHDVVGVHAVDLVWGLGTLHCLTQQQPAAG